MELIDVTIRESVYLENGMNENKALAYLDKYVELMPFEEVKNVEICFLDNTTLGTLVYDENFIRKAHHIVKDKFNLIAVIHPNLVDLNLWNPQIIKMFKTVRFMINTPMNSHDEEIIEYLHRIGVEVSINVIYVSRKDFSFIEQCVAIAKKHNVEYFCLADSCGNCLPVNVEDEMKALSDIKDKMKLNFHLHDHLGTAMANALACYEYIDILDCSVHGIGKGGGNLSLENILFATRRIQKKIISQDEITRYAELLKYLVKDILEADWEKAKEKFENLLVGVFNCNLKEVDAIVREAGDDFLKYCLLISKQEEE